MAFAVIRSAPAGNRNILNLNKTQLVFVSAEIDSSAVDTGIPRQIGVATGNETIVPLVDRLRVFGKGITPARRVGEKGLGRRVNRTIR